jgi:hypothetical protein
MNIARNVKMIEVSDWDDLVTDTYKRPYNFQQQDDCQDRGTYELTVPSEDDNEDHMNESVPEEVNGRIMGVKFKTWLERDPDHNVFDQDYENELFWDRNFYPSIDAVANDLHKKGLLEAGTYIINIDW